jgi:hypothetical protein
MRIAVCVAFLALVGCQAKDEPGPIDQAPQAKTGSQPQAGKPAQGTAGDEPVQGAAGDDYAGDIERICNAEQLSGAAEMDEGARSMHVAQWLGSNIKTEDGRQFLASLARAKAADKAKLLRSESSKVGLKGCALAKSWSGGGQSTL